MPEAVPPVKSADALSGDALSANALSDAILHWYSGNARALPWRNPPGHPLPANDADWPYRVWLSEIMLQQTTVVAAAPYFHAFTARWPSVGALAAADDGDVMQAWAGLGYYARARNLLACARVIMAEHGGQFPADEASLRRLPGVGSYTAAAIASFAFGQRAIVVDGNIERVVARLFAIATALPTARAEIAAQMDALTPETRAGDFAQALMDLARSICTPRNPKCLICPIASDCAGRGNPQAFPVKAMKTAKPDRIGVAYWIERDGHVWLIRRPEKGLLGGMRALPSDGWDRSGGKANHALHGGGAATTTSARHTARPSTTSWPPSPVGEGFILGSVTHVFTHFRLILTLVAIDAERGCALHPGGEWWPKAELENAGLPSLFVKAVRIAPGKDD